MTGKKNNKSKKNGILKFFGGVKAEVKKITWPTKIEAKKALVSLAVVAGIYLILVGGLDFIFQNLFEVILNLK